MNDRETRYLFNKYRRIYVTFINRFFHFCAFCVFARTSFHSTLFARLQTYLTKWCREFFFLRIRSTVTWWLWDWLKFSTFMTDNLCSSRKWVIKWSNDEKEKTTKKCYFMFKIIRSYFHIRWVFSFFSWSLIYVFDISFSSNEFFLHRFRQTTRYEFDKLIDEHVSYSSLNNEKISLLRALCLIFFFENSKRLTTRKEKRFH
jgi:hypothetical protein